MFRSKTPTHASTAHKVQRENARDHIVGETEHLQPDVDTLTALLSANTIVNLCRIITINQVICQQAAAFRALEHRVQGAEESTKWYI